MIRRVLFYSDLVGFGGHEVLTIDAARFMAGHPNLDVHFAYCEASTRLHESLREIKGLNLHPLPVKPDGLPVIRTLFWLAKLPLVRRLIESIAPDVVVVSQGNIELSALGLLASRRAGFRTISYIPMAHRIALPGKWSSPLHDIVDRCLYRLPDKFITSNETARNMLSQQGVTSEISIVLNGIELDGLPGQNKAENRKRYGFSLDEYVIGVMGRILFWQKAQDLVVNAVAAYGSQMPGMRFCIVGEGTDERSLRRMIHQRGVEKVISVLPWNDDPAPLYSALDMLLIPSRFEGMPLVMHEAMWYGLPIVASNVDGMAEVLPEEWLFERGNIRALVETVSRVRFADNTQQLRANRRRVLEEFSLRKFQERFCEEVIATSQLSQPQDRHM